MGSREDDFTAWARVNGRSLHARAFMLCQDHHGAEDLVQETFARLFARWPGPVTTGMPLAYAKRVLTNLYLDGQRRRWRREVSIDTSAADAPEPWRPGAADRDSIVDLEDRMVLLEHLSALTPPQRAVLLARYLDERSVAEVAVDHGRSPEWVAQTTRRALIALRRQLAALETDRSLP